MGEGGGGEALSLFRFHLSPFLPETPDTQARVDMTTAFEQKGVVQWTGIKFGLQIKETATDGFRRLVGNIKEISGK